MPSVGEILQQLEPLLARSDEDPRRIVVMTCGLAGAGKSTLSRELVQAHPTFERISIDVVLHAKHGVYRVDYPAEKHEEFQNQAAEECDARLLELLIVEDHDIMVDQSFYRKADRDEVKRLVESHGARWILVYLNATKEVLWKRIQDRRQGVRDADFAYDVTEQVLDRYLRGFDVPKGEGEIVIEVE
ncbi:hypothetical protein H2200_002271 [Cladophialophora chaetospira]|uniref:ATP/GTP-binding protein n=1 Tax=Cladophialophora chaetospira TaxID=386627 RepID=A0AA39CND5_9EURO|nr:hypothetical protein H2200_002271 [Cladophialophora chaetospira]